MKKYLFFVVVLFCGFAFNDVQAESPVFDFKNDLTIGSTGGDVAALQEWLESKGYLTMPPGVARGYLGPLTRAALVKFQISQGIVPPAGYFGPVTRAKLKQLAIVNPEVVDTGWKTYKNNEYLFKLDYSSKLTPVERDSPPNIIGSPEWVVGFRKSIDTGWTEDIKVIFYDEKAPQKLLGGESIRINGNRAFKKETVYDDLLIGGYSTLPITLFRIPLEDGDLVVVVFNGESVEDKTLSTFLSSFGTFDTPETRITPDTISVAKKGVTYSQNIQAEGFSGYMKWELIDSSLSSVLAIHTAPPLPVCVAILMADGLVPPGCGRVETYNASIVGRIDTSGTYDFTVRASDDDRSVTKKYTLVVTD